VPLLASYEQLRAEAETHLPHGPGLFKRLDKVFDGLASVSTSRVAKPAVHALCPTPVGDRQ
jgi:ferritin-like metal-binding protein YciE